MTLATPGSAASLILAYLLDRAVGDPPWLPHPVRLVGRAALGLEALLLREGQRPATQRLAGVVYLFLLAGATWSGTALLLALARTAHPTLAAVLEAALISTAVAPRGLREAAARVHQLLAAGRLDGAREAVRALVGRDTAGLPEAQVVRAAVESVAENTVDAVTAPLFYASLGGAPLALLYRTVNTLDAMVGYRNPRYRFFGWAAARADDALNYLPARLTVCLIPAAAAFSGLAARRAWRAARRDARRHPSPNAGWSEAAFAGALGVRLGGWNRYGGRPSFRPYLGDPTRPLERADILRAIHLMEATNLLFLGLAAALLALLGRTGTTGPLAP